MGLFKNLMWVSAAAILAACSSNEKVEADVESPTSGFDSEGNGYINVSISMPGGGGSGTRADLTDANDQFADGEESEYNVQNAALLLFTNAEDNENTAKFATAYQLSISWTNDASDADQITKRGSEVKRITDDGKKYKYALVALNYSQLFTVQADNTLYIGSKKFTGTFQEFAQQLVSANDGDAFGGFKYSVGESTTKTTYFFMTNTVLATAAGTVPTTSDNYSNSTIALAKVAEGDKTYIYKTAEAAKSGNAIEVIVERALAKVQLTKGSGVTDGQVLSDIEVKSSSSEGYNQVALIKETNNAKPIKWKLNNKNKSSYFVRNWGQEPTSGNATLYGDKWLNLYSDGDGLSSSGNLARRFAGTSKIAHSEASPGTNLFNPTGTYYRTYWCVDPNYETALYTGDNATTYDDTDYSDVGTSEYCFENTFDVAHQTHNNTALAMVKVQFVLQKSGTSPTDATDNTFYVISNVTKSTIYTKDALIEELKNASELSGKKNVTITFGKETTSGGTTTTGDVTESTSGKIVIKGLSYGENNATTEGTDGENVKALNKKYTIDRYPGGVAYYPILIKHFGDDLTPWNTAARTTGTAYPTDESSTTDGSGKSRNDRWLGRYGVVRNNWYLLNITSISNIGYPEPPTPTDTTDDEIDSWINVRVTMVSWAQRKQDISL